jgi:hypothetical protein
MRVSVVRCLSGTQLGPATLGSPTERCGMMLVPLTEANQSADRIVADRQGDGWKLVSKRMDKYGAEVIGFSRPG